MIQTIIGSTAIIALICIQLGNRQWRLFGNIVGLLGQPFWLWASWVVDYGGMFFSSCLYTIVYAVFAWRAWKEPASPAPYIRVDGVPIPASGGRWLKLEPDMHWRPAVMEASPHKTPLPAYPFNSGEAASWAGTFVSNGMLSIDMEIEKPELPPIAPLLFEVGRSLATYRRACEDAHAAIPADLSPLKINNSAPDTPLSERIRTLITKLRGEA